MLPTDSEMANIATRVADELERIKAIRISKYSALLDDRIRCLEECFDKIQEARARIGLYLSSF